jgi:apolipoprotein N-acyltransferase
MSDFSVAAGAARAPAGGQPPRGAADLLRDCLPGLAARGARNAELLVTISNDSWFGRSIGPLQHLQMARMRALENGRYLLRGTNNGVSAIIDHRGQVWCAQRAVRGDDLTGEAQVMLGHTPFTSFGSTPLLASLLVLLVLMSALYRTLWADLGPRS